MVTLISQFPNQFELHLRAILGLPIPSIELVGPSASAVILASQESDNFDYDGSPRRLRSAPRQPGRSSHVRQAQDAQEPPHGRRACPRRDVEDAVARAKAAAARVRMRYEAVKENAMRSHARIALLAAPRSPAATTAAATERADDQGDRAPSSSDCTSSTPFNLAIGLKRAIYDAGYTCKRITDAGFVGTYKNLDMWTAQCVYDKGPTRDWAIFAGPDGSAQVRDCRSAGNRPSRVRRSSSGRRAASTKRNRPQPGLPLGLHWRVSLYSPRGRSFLDRHAIALAHFLAPAAVRIGHAIALGTRLPSLIS